MSERKKMKMTEQKEEIKGVTPKYRIKSICIFGDTDVGKDMQFLTAAQDLGRALAARKINFVYGGGLQGLRGGMAMSATMRGSQGLNVRVKDLEQHTFSLGKELQVSNLAERMVRMFYNADAFIALPGGLETLDGISSVAYWAKLNVHKKPIGLLNVNGFYDSLLSFLDHAVEMRFISQAVRQTIVSAPTAEQLIDELLSYEPIANPVVQQTGEQSSGGGKQQDPDTGGQSSGGGQQQDPDTTLRL